MKAVVLFSGGQDSATCLLYALKKYGDVEALNCYYKQRHSVEVNYAKAFCANYHVPLKHIDLGSYGDLVKSALTDDSIEVKAEGGHLNLPTTFTPGRNLLFLTVAASYAYSKGCRTVVTGVCQQDYAGYLDCRREFIDSFQETFALATGKPIYIEAPLMYLTKAETWQMAGELDALDDIVKRTLTCYFGTETQNSWGRGCGLCGACIERKKGFEQYLAKVA